MPKEYQRAKVVLQLISVGRSELETLFLTKETKLVQKDNTILADNGTQKIRLPVETLSHIVVTCQSTLSTSLISLCGAYGIRISFFDYYGWYKGSFEPVERNSSGETAVRQAICATGESGLDLAKDIVAAAIKNSCDNLRYYFYRHNENLKVSIDYLDNIKSKIIHAKTKEELMGFEGLARRTYLESWKIVDEKLDFGKRVKRPPNNQVNCLISFINSLCYSSMKHELAKTHLLDTISFLHAPSEARSSLSLDLTEPFKPLITDVIIWKTVRNGELKTIGLNIRLTMYAC